MNWTIDWGKQRKRLKGLDRQNERRVRNKLDKVAESGNPRENGKALTGEYAGQWVYRIGDYRARVILNDAQKVIEVLEVKPRGGAYRRRKLHRISEDGGDWNPAGDGDDDGI